MLEFDPALDLATDEARLLVNTTNTRGRMGKGVALVMKTRFPEIMPAYERACANGTHAPGTIQLIRTGSGQTVLNMATKDAIYEPSRPDWVGSGLVYLNRILTERAELFPTVAMPLPGCGNGGLDPAIVSRMLSAYLEVSSGQVAIRVRGERPDHAAYPVHYAGVGSRDTPEPVMRLMRELAAMMAEAGRILRSGGAIGADTAFYEGVQEAGGPREIFLAKARSGIKGSILHVSDVQRRMALAFHPAPDAIRPVAGDPRDRRHSHLALMARNGNQVFGTDFTMPSDLVLCWTEGGKGCGGTGQAIRLARSAGIPVLDLGAPIWRGAAARDVLETAEAMIRDRRSRIRVPMPVVDADPVAEPG